MKLKIFCGVSSATLTLVISKIKKIFGATLSENVPF